MYNKAAKIRDHFLAGRSAYDAEQFKLVLLEFQGFIDDVINGNLFAASPELIKISSEIFDAAFSGRFEKSFAALMNKNKFYDYGQYLLSGKLPATGDLKIHIHHYLDLLRLSVFLQKIYNEKKWEKLILDLILKSGYTLSDLIKQRTTFYPNKILFKVLSGRNEEDFTWHKTVELINSYSGSLISLLKETGDVNGKIAFLMENSLQMALLDLACLTSGVVNIMIPANSVAQHVEYILNQTKASVLITSDEKELAKIRIIKNDTPHLKKVVLLNGIWAEDWVMSFREFLSLPPAEAESAAALAKNVVPDNLATMMYTSGTTGEPKGIMFSHLNIIYKRFCRALAIPGIGDEDRFLAYLPLYHTFGRYFEMTGSLFWNAEYVFMENPSVETMITNMRRAKPSIFISVPKKWIQLYEEILKKIDPEFSSEAEIISTVMDITGGNLKWGLSAAGFLPPEIFQFFQKYGVELISGFGMTEATGGITMTPPGGYVHNSLGKALPGVEIKLSEDGELLIRGSYVMTGYYGDENQNAFDDEGWFATGDVMTMDPNGYINIIDRKKEIYKNNKGETVAPQKIENYFNDFEFISQVFLVGDRRPFNTVLIYPKKEIEDSILAGLTPEQKHEYFSSIIVTVNKFLAPFERIVDFRIIDRPFSAEHDELTPKGTFKRRVIEKNFNDLIESMYEKHHTQVRVKDVNVLVPNWFLREKGCLSGDVESEDNFLSIPKLGIKLCIEKFPESGTVRLGSFRYEVRTDRVDLQNFLINPIYWLGNKELFDFAGEAIFQWYRHNSNEEFITFHSKVSHIVDAAGYASDIESIGGKGEYSLRGLNLAVYLLQAEIPSEFGKGLNYITDILKDDSLPVFKIALEMLKRPQLTDPVENRRDMFIAMLSKVEIEEISDLLEFYHSFNFDLLDARVIKSIINNSREDIVTVLEDSLEREVARNINNKNIHITPVPNLFKLLTNYGISHPTRYERIRQICVVYQLHREWPSLMYLAFDARYALRDGFRSWLGSNPQVAVDPETGEEYGWEDVIVFEDEIDADDKERILKALKESAILKEAIFFYSRGKLVRLDDIVPRGIWISHLRSYHDKSVYRTAVQTRFHGSFDIVLNLNKKLSKESVREEVNWLILAGSRHFVQELVEDFGGYWEAYDMWSGKFVPGDTVAKHLQREIRRNDPAATKRVFELWAFFVWNAAAAYSNFWRLTGYRLQLADPSPNNFIIPPHDYQTGTRVVSFSERREWRSYADFFENFYMNFIVRLEEEYPFLHEQTTWYNIFSGLINTEGEGRGIGVLEKFREELIELDKPGYLNNALEHLETFLATVKSHGYIPKQLYFAIKRFNRWYRLNPNADLGAQAETIFDIHETYHLIDLEKNYPEARTRFFLDTVFAESSESVRIVLTDIMMKQKNRNVTKDETLNLLTDFQSEFILTEKESYFLTRLTYPHIKPSDSVSIIRTKTEGQTTADLVVKLTDYEGNPFMIRRPVSPKEISRLYQLFIDANLMVNFRPEHQFLVAVSERGFIIGGLFFYQTDEQAAHMEKIVVSNRYRKMGISEGLMNELFNRLKGENLKYLTTGFFRPEYFYRFGFKIEKKYSGLVKELED